MRLGAHTLMKTKIRIKKRIMSQQKQLFRLGLQLVLMSFLIVLSAEKGEAQNLTQVYPNSGAPESTIDLFGNGFDDTAGDHIVTFTPVDGGTGTDATPSALTNGKLTVDVPAGLSAGNYQLSVTRDSDNSTATLTSIFSVLSSSGGSFNDINAGLTGVINSSSDWGDYDGDGDLDLVVTGYEASSGTRVTTIYENDNGSFSAVGAGLTALRNGSSEWGDYDSDGDLDLILTGTNSSGTATSVIYRNDGGGTFINISAGLTGVKGGTGTWGDYDNDGDLDLVIVGTDASDNTTATIYRNDGSDTFAAIRAGLTGVGNTSGSSADWGDYDGDGDLDLVITGEEEGFLGERVSKIYRNNGDDTFTDIAAGLTGVLYGSSAWGDYDEDGDLDLVITGEDDAFTKTATIYRNDGSDTFTDINAGLTGVLFGSSDWGDYDGDGDLDLLIKGEDGSSNATAIIFRNNDGSFTDIKAELTGVENGSGDWGDYDGDGQLDLILTGEDESGTRSASIYKNLPLLEFISISPQSGISGTQVTLNGGGFGTSTSDITVSFTPAGGGTDYEVTPSSITNGTQLTATVPTGVATGDYTVTISREEDNSTETLSTLFSVSTRDFIDIVAGITDFEGGTIRWGDYDGDGDPDLLIAAFNESDERITKIYRNDNGSFNDINADIAEGNAASWGDYEGDGDLDFLVTGIKSGFETYRGSVIYINDGSGSFNAKSTDVNNASKWADYDGDGDLDLVSNNIAGATLIYRNDGASFTDIGKELTGGPGGSRSWGDYDNDGDLDLVITGTDGVSGFDEPISTIYRNDGNDTFTNINAGLAGVGGTWNSSSDWGDYDNDGDLDLVISGQAESSRRTIIYRNDGNDTFTEISTGLTNVRFSSSNWGDYDNDGDLDLVSTGVEVSGNRKSIIYRNDGNDTFTNINAGLTGVKDGSSDWGDYDGDGDLDLAIIGSGDSFSPTTSIYENKLPTSPVASISIPGPNEGWRMISSPAANTTLNGLLGDFWTQGIPGSDDPEGEPTIYYWDESSRSFVLPGSMSEVMDPGKGYITYIYDDQDFDGNDEGFPKTLTATGEEHPASSSVSVSSNDTGSDGIKGDEGWNLVSNPFSVSIKVDELLAAARSVNSNVNANVYIWDPNKSGGAGYQVLAEGDSEVVAPFQSFWIRYLQDGVSGSLSMDKSTLEGSGGTFFKENQKQPQVILSLKHGNLSDEFTLRFDEKESVKIGLDLTDGYQMQPLTNRYVQFYSLLNENEPVAVNRVPYDISSPTELPLIFESAGGEGKTVLRWTANQIPDDIKLILKDKHTGKVMTLDGKGEYSFSLNPAKTVAESSEKLKKNLLASSAKTKEDARFILTITPDHGQFASNLPQEVRLNQNYPNPFNPTTVIRYGVPEQANVQLSIFNTLGQRVARLINSEKSPGHYEVNFNASSLSSGLYFYRLKVGGDVLTKKMMLIK